MYHARSCIKCPLDALAWQWAIVFFRQAPRWNVLDLSKFLPEQVETGHSSVCQEIPVNDDSLHLLTNFGWHRSLVT